MQAATRHSLGPLRAADLVRVVAPVLILAGSGCVSGRPAVVGPLPDAPRIAADLQDRADVEGPVAIFFDWRLSEEGQRFDGEGVARIEPPYRARLDLFWDGETAATAALVDGELRRGFGTHEDILPPPELMWGVLGVFRPQPGSSLLGGDELEDGATRLRYALERGRELHYELAGDFLRSVELLEGSHVVQRVEAQPSEDGRYPSRATYRNLSEYRELTLERSALEPRDPFDPDIWDPVLQ